MNSWGVFKRKNEIHVAPVSNHRVSPGHFLGDICVCNPKKEVLGTGILFTHNPLKGETTGNEPRV